MCLRKEDLIKSQKNALQEQAQERAELLKRIKRLEDKELKLSRELREQKKKLEISSAQPRVSHSDFVEGSFANRGQPRDESYEDSLAARAKIDSNSAVIESSEQPSWIGFETVNTNHENLPPARISIADRPTVASARKKRSIFDSSTKVLDPHAFRNSQRTSMDKSPSAQAIKPPANEFRKAGDNRKKTTGQSTTPQKTRDNKSLSFSVASGHPKSGFSAESHIITPLSDEQRPFHNFRQPGNSNEVRSFSPTSSRLTPIPESVEEPPEKSKRNIFLMVESPHKSQGQRDPNPNNSPVESQSLPNSTKINSSSPKHNYPSQSQADLQNTPNAPNKSEEDGENIYRKHKQNLEEAFNHRPDFTTGMDGDKKTPEAGGNKMQADLNKSANELNLFEARPSTDLSSKKRAPFKISYSVAQLENGEELAFIDSGPSNVKYAVVAIHGELTTSAIFIDLMARIRSKIRVVAIDLRGYGKSSYNKSFFSLNDLAEDVAEVVEMLGLARISLIGYSLGGGICLTFAALYPQLLEKVILLNSIGLRGVGTPQKPKTFDQLQSDEDITTIKAHIKVSDTSYFLERLSKYSKIMPPTIFPVFCKEIASHKALQDTLFVLGTANLNELIGKIRSNILFIHGQKNTFCNVDVAKETAKALGYRAKLDVWENCDQNILAFDSKKLEKTILEFLFDEESDTLTE